MRFPRSSRLRKPATWKVGDRVEWAYLSEADSFGLCLTGEKSP